MVPSKQYGKVEVLRNDNPFTGSTLSLPAVRKNLQQICVDHKIYCLVILQNPNAYIQENLTHANVGFIKPERITERLNYILKQAKQAESVGFDEECVELEELLRHRPK